MNKTFFSQDTEQDKKTSDKESELEPETSCSDKANTDLSENNTDSGEQSSEITSGEVINVNTVEADVDVSEAKVNDDIRETSEPRSEEGAEGNENIAEADIEETSEPDTEEITVIETIMYDVKRVSDINSEKAIETNVDKISYADIEGTVCEDNQEINSDSAKIIYETESCDLEASITTEDKTGESVCCSTVDNGGDHTVNNTLDR